MQDISHIAGTTVMREEWATGRTHCPHSSFGLLSIPSLDWSLATKTRFSALSSPGCKMAIPVTLTCSDLCHRLCTSVLVINYCVTNHTKLDGLKQQSRITSHIRYIGNPSVIYLSPSTKSHLSALAIKVLTRLGLRTLVKASTRKTCS